jgi:hypothetical protein
MYTIVYVTLIYVSLSDLIAKTGKTRFFETNNSLRTVYKQEQNCKLESKEMPGVD